jgi:translation initiation factor 1A
MNEETESEYGDFEEIKEPNEENGAPEEQEQQMMVRARMPRQGQFIGVVLERLGGKRMSIKTTDNKVRNCRVPGRFRRKFWLRPGNFVMIEPWPDDDNKGDIVYQYRPPEITQLKKRGLLDNLKGEF